MDIVALSDLHGILPEITQPFDLMLLGGDVVNLYCQSSPKNSEDWYLDEFLYWINSLPYKDGDSKVILIAGNHDVGIFRMKSNVKIMFLEALKERSNYRVIYLENELYDFTCKEGSVSIFGTPWCKIFGHWAFMANDESLKEKYSHIPENVDILLTHDSPSIEKVGTILQETSWSDGSLDVGNKILSDEIINKQPKLVLSGHIHSGNHELSEYSSGKFIKNISILDENYNQTYPIFYFKWPLVLQDL